MKVDTRHDVWVGVGDVKQERDSELKRQRKGVTLQKTTLPK